MSDPASEGESAYHLLLEPDEAAATAGALRVLISDEAHQTQIRNLARAVLARLPTQPGATENATSLVPEGAAPARERAQLAGEEQILSVPLSPQEMKITHTAVRSLLNDLQREQDDERQILWRIIEKLPDEHAIRAITLD